MRVNKRKTGVKQHDITDCGAACLCSVAAHFNLKYPISRIRQYASTDKKGTNVLGMIEAARKIGFHAKGVKGDAESLDKIPLPAIAHITVKEVLHHYVVIYKVTDKEVHFMDPMDGKMHRLSIEDFNKQWTGVLILLAPDEHFEPKSEKVSITSRLWFLLQPHKGVLIQALTGAAVYTILGLSTAIFVQVIVDYVLADGNANLLNLLGVGMLTLLLLSTFIGITKTVFVLKTGQLIDARLILGYYKHLLKLPQQFFDTMRVGEIISRIGDAVKIRILINDGFINIIVNVFIVIFSFALMFTYYWKLGLFMLCIIPMYTLIYAITNYINKKTQRRVMEDSADLEAQLVESLNSASTVKQFGLEDYANVKTETRFVTLLNSIYRSGLNSVFSDYSSQFTSRLFTILLLWLGAYYVLNQAITPGELLSFYAIIGYFTGPANSLIQVNRLIQDAMIAADRLFEIMDLDKEEEEKKLTLTSDLIGDIQFEDVHFRYGARQTVFEKLNLTIPKGSVAAFVGESGSGKTTIINALLKLYPIESGSIKIGDLSLNHIETDSLRKFISVVPQKIDLFSGNVVQNIAVGEFQPDMEKVINICRNIGILPFIESLPHGFETHLGENGATFSGGQKQRIAIARALYKDPEILILDEATSSLDSSSESYINQAIKHLKEQGKTVIVITHRLSTVFVADNIFVLDQGELVEKGTHDELIQNQSIYFELWRNQIPFLQRKHLAELKM